MPKTLNPNMVVGEVHHEWAIQEYESHERSSWWYIVMITIGLGLVAYAMFTLNFLFAISIVLVAIILFLQSHDEAMYIPFAITELGIVVGNKFYEYKELSQFYIIYQPPEVKSLFIETKSALRPIIRIHLHDQNPIDVRDSLRQYLSEDLDKEEEPLADTFVRRLKIH
jgi:hypothetical protein